MMSYVDPEAVPAPVGAARVGADLHGARQRLGWALPDVANGLRIRLVYLEAIEEGRLSALPGNAYAMGFVRTYASALGLDPDEVSRRFRAEAQGVTKKTELSFPAPVPQRGVPAGAVVLLGLLIAAGAYIGWYRYTGSDEARVAQVATAPPDRLVGLVPAPAMQSPQVASMLPSAPQPVAGAAMAVLPPVVPVPVPIPVPVPVPVSVAPPVPVAAPASTRVVLHAKAGGWVQVKERQGQILLNRVLRAGETWPVPMRPKLLLTTSNAGAMELLVDGVAAPPLGPVGSYRHDLSLDPDMVKAGHTSVRG